MAEQQPDNAVGAEPQPPWLRKPNVTGVPVAVAAELDVVDAPPEGAVVALLAEGDTAAAADGDLSRSPFDDGVTTKRYPLRVAELYALLLESELSSGRRADPNFMAYLSAVASQHDDRAAPPSSTAALATVKLDYARAVALRARSAVLARDDGVDPCAQSALPVREDGVITTTRNIAEIDLRPFHLSEDGLMAVAMLLPFCVNLTTLRFAHAKNATPAVLQLLFRNAGVHPSLRCLDLSGTFIEWAEIDLLSDAVLKARHLVDVTLDATLCACPPTMLKRLTRRVEQQALALARTPVHVRGTFDPTPFAALRSVSDEALSRIWVPWQV